MSLDLLDSAPSSRRRTSRPSAPIFDLSLSENPFPPLPSVVAAVNYEVTRSNRYPEFVPDRLPALIGGQLGVDAERVAVGAGATGVAMQILRSVPQPGTEIVLSSPTFDGYPIMATMAGLRLVPVPLAADGAQDLDALRRSIHKGTGLVIVCRPHNPTGTVVPADDLRAFLTSVPKRIPLILDEAYVEFLAAADHLDHIELLRRHPNLLVLRTFSKAYGLAGLRIGYVVGHPDLIARVRTQQLPFGTPTLAVAAVTASYAAFPELRTRIRSIDTARDRLWTVLRGHGIAVPPSRANFLYLPGPGPATLLRRAGIHAKCYPDGSARVAVGDPAADRAILTALLPHHSPT
ncbi:aminotransferase class I/II-fold pyridoxal phosphate-dependent enzyme [Nocardia takedensis]